MVQHRSLAAPTYLVAFALVCIPPFDAIMQVLPPRLGDPKWRWGAFGLLSNAMMIPLTGLLIAFIAAAFFEHFRFQRILGVIAVLIGLGTAGFFAIFALDALQIRQEVKPAAQLAFRVASSTAAIKSILGMLTLGAFAFASLKTPKQVRVTKSTRGAGLIFGAKGAPINSSIGQSLTTDRVVNAPD